MIVYVTRPDNHEVVMGGWRHVPVWTDKPHYHHWPVHGWRPMPSENQKAVYYDRGWSANGDHESGCRFKPLAKQNEQLADNVWRLLLWSCIPKTDNVRLEGTFEWANTLLPGEKREDEFHRTNLDRLLYHFGGETDLDANVHYKRFLMEVNLLTAECKLIVPRVHIYMPDPVTTETVETQDITEYLAKRRNYECPDKYDDIPF